MFQYILERCVTSCQLNPVNLNAYRHLSDIMPRCRIPKDEIKQKQIEDLDNGKDAI
jgi:hypothetical protein